MLHGHRISNILFKGIMLTILREVPSYAVEFFTYRTLTQSVFVDSLSFGAFNPLVCGAIAGCVCWIPVYPIDLVKTRLQRTPAYSNFASDKESMNEISQSFEIAQDLYKQGGISSFFDGIGPLLMKCAISHSVTFWVYDSLMTSLIKSCGICTDVC